MIKKKIHKSISSIIAQNKRARHEYFIEKELESGLSLRGWEVKSLRAGKANISNSYVLLQDGEAYLFGVNFQPLGTSFLNIVYNPIRTRKLLLNRHELDLLFGYVTRKRYTIVVLLLYWKKAWVKVKIGIAKGKREYDKRTDIKKREWQCNKIRVMKHTK